MGYVGIPAAVLFADVPGFEVVGVQRRSARSGWKIDLLNAGGSPFPDNEPGIARADPARGAREEDLPGHRDIDRGRGTPTPS